MMFSRYYYYMQDIIIKRCHELSLFTCHTALFSLLYMPCASAMPLGAGRKSGRSAVKVVKHAVGRCARGQAAFMRAMPREQDI